MASTLCCFCDGDDFAFHREYFAQIDLLMIRATALHTMRCGCFGHESPPEIHEEVPFLFDIDKCGERFAKYKNQQAHVRAQH